VRLADGGLWWLAGGATAVELERDVKRLDRYQAAVADVDPAWSSGVWWFTPRAQVGLLQQRLQDAGAGAHHEVVTAPKGGGPVTLPREFGRPAGLATPSGPPPHPLDQRVHDPGNDRHHQVVLVVAGAVA
jgi:hypothetical protein